MTLKPSTVILYVEKVESSCAFYAKVLGRPPAEQSANFAMFALEGGMMLGLWAGHDVQPKPKAAGGGAEVAFALSSDAELDALHAEWSRKGFTIAQKPVRMDFAYTFTALDPDGHRVRVMVIPQG
jgi:catechol 2,3-dioxygenase-like lactoylglutathione lyase family enzyme